MSISRLFLTCVYVNQDVQGLEDCKKYMSQKQHYTLQDMLVVQYILNDGILMRQMHGTQDEYHVDIEDPLQGE